MKRHLTLVLTIILISGLILTSCTGTTETAQNNADNKPTENTGQTQSTDAPVATDAATAEPTPETTPEPTPEPGVTKIALTNTPDSTGNTAYSASHYGLHIAYGQEMVTVMNYMTMFNHGGEIARVPDKVEGFEYQAEDLQYYNGFLYFLIYDFDTGAYNLYKYDGENPPEKVCDSTVYHYEFINGTIYFMKEFYQGPIYSMNPDGSGETQLTTMRAHSFVNDGQSLYFYSTDAGTAPGLVKYNIGTGEETTVIFPFYSHNYLVHGGYIYYSVDSGTYRSIHRASLANQTVEDIWLEMTDFTISMNISDGMLYLLVGDSVYKSGIDGSNRVKILQAEEGLQTGLYIFGDRIYCMDYSFIYCVKTDGSETNMFSLNLLQ